MSRLALRRRSPCVAIGLLLCACGAPGELVSCPPVRVPAQYDINIIVKDSVTRADAARGVTATARDGAYSDSVTVPLDSYDGVMIGLVPSRVGTYAVTLRKPGYNDWLATVNVAATACGIKADTVTARLQPAPPRP